MTKAYGERQVLGGVDLAVPEHRAIALIGAAVNDTTPRKVCADGKRPAPCFALDGGSYVVSGAPVGIGILSAGIILAIMIIPIVTAMFACDWGKRMPSR